MNGRLHVLISIPLLFATLGSAAQLAHAAGGFRDAKISITNLGTLGGPESVALDINAYGDVVGWSHVKSGRQHAFLSWSFGPMVDISNGYTNFDTIATGINRQVDIVGTIIPPAAPAETYGFYHPLGGSMTQLEHVLDAGTAEYCLYKSRAEAINDRGYIAGTIGLARDLHPDDAVGCLLDSKAALWSSPVAPELVAGSVDTPHPEWGLDLDERQTVVGASKATVREGVRWRTSGVRTQIPTPPPYREYIWTVSRANGIANTGWIAATYDVRISGVSTTRAILWNGSSANSNNLGVLPGGSRSGANDVSDAGFVVGFSNAAGTPNRGFIWHKELGMMELPPLTNTGECQAHAVNDPVVQNRVQVAGYCVNAAGNRRAVRWDVLLN